MPRIIVTADRPSDGGDRPIMFAERVNVSDFESAHFQAQLVQRLGWAVGDADAVEHDDHCDPVEHDDRRDPVEHDDGGDPAAAERPAERDEYDRSNDDDEAVASPNLARTPA